EEQPPHDDAGDPHEAADEAVDQPLGADGRQAVPQRHQHDGGRDARPDSERLARSGCGHRYSDLSAWSTSTREAFAAGRSEARSAAPPSNKAAASRGNTPGRLAGSSHRAAIAISAYAPAAPAAIPIATIAPPSSITRTSRRRGEAPTANRTPNSRVRALTE